MMPSRAGDGLTRLYQSLKHFLPNDCLTTPAAFADVGDRLARHIELQGDLPVTQAFRF